MTPNISHLLTGHYEGLPYEEKWWEIDPSKGRIQPKEDTVLRVFAALSALSFHSADMTSLNVVIVKVCN